MNTMSFNTVQAAFKAERASMAKSAGPSLLQRLIGAVTASRQAKAEVETRRIRALLGQDAPAFDYALLPFRGE